MFYWIWLFTDDGWCTFCDGLSDKRMDLALMMIGVHSSVKICSNESWFVANMVHLLKSVTTYISIVMVHLLKAIAPGHVLKNVILLML